MKCLQELGLLDFKERLVNGVKVAPIKVVGEVLKEKLAFPNVGDLVILIVEVKGKDKATGETKLVRFEMLDLKDTVTGFSAMERTTGFSASICAQMLLRGQGIDTRGKKGGFLLPEDTFDTDVFIAESEKRDIKITRRTYICQPANLLASQTA